MGHQSIKSINEEEDEEVNDVKREEEEEAALFFFKQANSIETYGSPTDYERPQNEANSTQCFAGSIFAL